LHEAKLPRSKSFTGYPTEGYSLTFHIGLILANYNPLQSKSGATMDSTTSFEHVVRELGLSPDQYRDSLPLRQWVQVNKDQKYVPTDLLKAWGFLEDD
jgi:hypothetical protein